ncbi:tegument protein [Alcelaphine gammaherpesvirus 1]|uniref:Inner tegument protein n=1 Tax=Alcelaphine herpesvirus 1 (strain C500) TaxID=654901 RepID=ITP_ALHV1|nr:tegument protein [Alcelaphine gammaherpesvirus 1]O36413.1 RecName: Full=Inner tegument protein [Alcelaphine herpesvirus 1 strain C500]AAC58110.1 tegument protein [Alcelaphine gammaherpesvirus 1]APB09486.1 tegument protein UL37 [Alcelaphine gammaherpesvirus 1]APB09558.1 tegument protein UL37 [Alcelaphine gammaherpesvirus 1]
MMENKRSLLKITQNIQNVTSKLAKLREILDLEMKMIDATELCNQQLVVKFLNSLPQEQGGLIEFVTTHYVYFLFKNCTLSPQFLERGTEHEEVVSKCLHLLKSAVECMSQITSDLFGCQGSGLLSNRNILSELQLFLTWAQNVNRNSTELTSLPTTPVQTFLCAEEIMSLLYLSKLYNTIPSVQFNMPNFQTMGVLEQWTISLYTSTVGLPTGPYQLPNATELACALVSRHADLFISPTHVSQPLLTFPFAKKRANLIFQSYLNNPQASITETGPLVQLREADLQTLDTTFFFLYDYIFEALSNNQAYSCSAATVNNFIARCVDSLTDLGSNLLEASTASRGPSNNIDAFKGFLLRAGLTEKNCSDFKTLLLLNKSNGHTQWKQFPKLLRLVTQLTLTAHYFYACLQQYSPTSLARCKITDTLKMAAAEQMVEYQASGSGKQSKPFEWTIPGILSFFIPQPPTELLQVMSDNISSPYMQSFFWISAHRAWQLKPHTILQRELSPTPLPSSPCNEEDVKKYCREIQVGDTAYQLNIVKCDTFELEFIKTHAFPILQNIFSMDLHIHRAMVQLRWLITFAADAPPFLSTLRKPLILLYFQINDIISQNRVDTSFINMLDYTKDVLTAVQEAVPSAEFSPNLINYLFLTHFSSSLKILMDTVNEFVTETTTVAESVASLARVGATICHSVFSFNTRNDTLEFPIAGENGDEIFQISVPAFKSTVANLQQNCYDVIVLLNESSRELHASYLDLQVISSDIDSMRNHSIKFDHASLNFKGMKDFYIKCFALQNKLASKIANTCCYSLTRRFAPLFEPELISLQTVENILNFSDTVDDPSVFLSGINQPMGCVPPNCQQGAVEKLSKQDVLDIRELAPDFTEGASSAPANATVIKHNFTGTFDKVSIDLDQSSLNTEFTFADKEYNLRTLRQLKLIFLEDLLSNTPQSPPPTDPALTN